MLSSLHILCTISRTAAVVGHLFLCFFARFCHPRNTLCPRCHAVTTSRLNSRFAPRSYPPPPPVSPAHLRTTTLATAAGLKRGLGFGLGSLIGGVMYSRLGARLCFRFSACLPLLALFLMYLSRRTRACGEKEWKEEEGGAIEMGLEGWERTGGPGEREGE